MKQLRNQSMPWLCGALFILGGYVIGASIGLPTSAHAEVREVTPNKAFKSGGARSEIVLKEIAAILKVMDTRLVNIEEAATELAATRKK